jgi:phosphatidylglycerophosphate synthase
LTESKKSTYNDPAEEMMNFPNLITLFRILLIPFLINSLIYRFDKLGWGILLFAFISDGLNGILSRLNNKRTLLGTNLDPIADKRLATGSFIALHNQFDPGLGLCYSGQLGY